MKSVGAHKLFLRSVPATQYYALSYQFIDKNYRAQKEETHTH